jgi:fatty acid desaturase
MHEDPTIIRQHATTRAEIAKLHEFEHWPAQWMVPTFIATLAFGGAATVAMELCWPLLFVILPLQSALMFVFVLSFHDASHGRLHPVHGVNEAVGHALGTVMWTPLNVYRFAHARHHAQLGRPGDPELWPFNSPNVPRPLRMLAAFLEIVFGFVYTPILFLRSVFVGKLTHQERQMAMRGYIACICCWTVVMAVVIDFHLWHKFLLLSVTPMAISGALQTLNKFEQHLGLHGQTVLGLTRTVVDRRKFGEMISAAMLYNDYHGTHHRYAKIPYYYLPQATPYALAGAREYCPVFPSIVSATIDMLRFLIDPKVGPQWNAEKDGPHFKVGASSTVAPIAQPVFTGSYGSTSAIQAQRAGSQ